MFKFFNVISTDKLHFESTITPAVHNFGGWTLLLKQEIDNKVYDATRGGEEDDPVKNLGYSGGPENIHYLVVLPEAVIKYELNKLMVIDNSLWNEVKHAKRHDFSMLK